MEGLQQFNIATPADRGGLFLLDRIDPASACLIYRLTDISSTTRITEGASAAAAVTGKADTGSTTPTTIHPKHRRFCFRMCLEGVCSGKLIIIPKVHQVGKLNYLGPAPPPDLIYTDRRTAHHTVRWNDTGVSRKN
ncbi:hypothetical protein BV898_07181 [Hypsibius exemplaris]|uniref:Uncharacterized protein n=1 Tax=Hypsibius exemplaris TaxID=2072580 RepID=A0A1W0WU69_HYPEX|nr:hypothetical protein BV898_07181 [Hypsibius exemplaris]